MIPRTALKIILCVLLWLVCMGYTWNLDNHGYILGIMYGIAISYYIIRDNYPNVPAANIPQVIRKLQN